MKSFSIIIPVVILLLANFAFSIGINMSYFFPSGGYFSNPIAPLSLKDFGLTLGDFFGVSTSISLYHIGGMKIKGLPFEMDKPGVGPFTSFNLALFPKVIIPLQKAEATLFAGGFVFYNFNPKLLSGNIEQALAQAEGWDTAQTQLKFDNKWGKGMLYGASFTYYLRENLGLVLSAVYYDGSSSLNLRGECIGGKEGRVNVKKQVSYPSSKLDYRGIEFSLGVELKSK
jgi:hypothetical protein